MVFFLSVGFDGTFIFMREIRSSAFSNLNIAFRALVRQNIIWLLQIQPQIAHYTNKQRRRKKKYKSSQNAYTHAQTEMFAHFSL